MIGNGGNNLASVQPSRWDLCGAAFFPALKRRAIFTLSRWDKARGNVACDETESPSHRAGIPAGCGDL